jgi:hypothetical protein
LSDFNRGIYISDKKIAENSNTKIGNPEYVGLNLNGNIDSLIDHYNKVNKKAQKRAQSTKKNMQGG